MRLAYTDELEHLSNVWPKLDGRSRYLLESHSILEKSPYEIAANLGIKPDSVRTVSYTHLDVYKRQVFLLVAGVSVHVSSLASL